MGDPGRPSLSVLVPVRDGERYLEEAIRSVLAEGWEPIEVLVVDDGSTDGSAAVAESFGPPVRCIRRPPLGQASARNAAVSAATGDLHLHLDADDLVVPGAIGKLAGMLVADPSIDLVTGCFETFLSPDASDELRQRVRIPEEAQRGHLSGTSILRASSVSRVGPIDESMPVLAALDWYTRAIDAGLTVRVVPEVVLRRRIHGRNTSLVQGRDASTRMRFLKSVLDRRRTAGREPTS
jgi:glycosyltransferase involved in cell wall biosynthesis